MVLQRGVKVPVWGTADNGEEIKVEIAGQKVTTISKQGMWMVSLNPMKVGGPFEMIISGTENTLTIRDVLVGEVWICSGQSNMERQLGTRSGQLPNDNWEKDRDSANYPQIRQYLVPHKYSHTPVCDVNSSWTVCSPETVADFTAVGFYFAKALYEKLNVPIGIVLSAVGGTEAKCWTSTDAMASNPGLKILIDEYNDAVKQYPHLFREYQENKPYILKQYRLDSLQAVKDSKPLPHVPRPPKDPSSEKFPGSLYNAMIYPLQPYAIKGIIWWQGENDHKKPSIYSTLFPAMIADWRAKWKKETDKPEDFPFLFVQIAPSYGIGPEIREAQLISWQKTKNTAMVVTTDCGHPVGCHTPYKKPIGERLALAARALAYNEKIEYSGPVYSKMRVRNDKIVLSFKHAGKELISQGDILKGFEIAGKRDSCYVAAKAWIKGNKVIVRNDAILHPFAVRYGWEKEPNVNLYNREGLPASPFRTFK